jgi:hypothetical protein
LLVDSSASCQIFSLSPFMFLLNCRTVHGEMTLVGTTRNLLTPKTLGCRE